MKFTEEVELEINSFVFDFIESYQFRHNAEIKRMNKTYMNSYDNLRKTLADDNEKHMLEAIFCNINEAYKVKVICAVISGIKFYNKNNRLYDETDGEIGEIAGFNKWDNRSEYKEYICIANEYEEKFMNLLDDNQKAIYSQTKKEHEKLNEYTLRQVFKSSAELMNILEEKFCI